MTYSFPRSLSPKSFNVDLYRFSEKIKKNGLVKIKKNIQNKKPPTDRLYVLFCHVTGTTHIFFDLKKSKLESICFQLS